MGNGTSPLAFLVLTILLKITSQQTVDICSGPTHLRAAGCAPEEEVIECNSEGKYCYIYDALLPFCPQHETFFDSPFGAIRAEGSSHLYYYDHWNFHSDHDLHEDSNRLYKHSRTGN